ncbi:gas vesicle protein GvpO [Halobium salinum]|uniref:Gas vesicle protein GvpO n=1 Tax=Halobium salinum TaxID=1364940 RepID=A0ABD5PHI0_9EURY|nr:gas vesicle protein GvpO [Halobium salinum]
MDDDTDVGDVDGIDQSTAEKLRKGGYETLGDLRGVERSALFDVEGIGASHASQVLSAVKEATEGDHPDGDDSDGAEEDGDDGDAGGDEDDAGEDDEDETHEDGADADSGTTADDAGGSNAGSDDGDGSDAVASIVEVRDAARATAAELIGHDLDGVIQVTSDGEGWITVVEVVERHSVPDTQDILGRYELDLDESARVTGYRRVGRYRRADSDVDEV